VKGLKKKFKSKPKLIWKNNVDLLQTGMRFATIDYILKIQSPQLWFPHNFRDRVEDMWGDVAGLIAFYAERVPGVFFSI
jgi:hypothetical protein